MLEAFIHRLSKWNSLKNEWHVAQAPTQELGGGRVRRSRRKAGAQTEPATDRATDTIMPWGVAGLAG